MGANSLASHYKKIVNYRWPRAASNYLSILRVVPIGSKGFSVISRWGSPNYLYREELANLTNLTIDDFDRFLSQENEIHSFKMIECRLSLYGKTSTNGQPNSIGHHYDI